MPKRHELFVGLSLGALAVAASPVVAQTAADSDVYAVFEQARQKSAL